MSGDFDYMLGLLVLLIAAVLVALLLPVPDPPRDERPSHDTTHTRRRP